MQLKNITQSAAVRRTLATGAFVAVMVPASLAQTTPDWGPTITGFKTDITTMLTTYGPLVIGLMVTVFGFRFVVRWIKRSLSGL